MSQRRQEERGGPHEGPPGLSGASPGTSRAVTHRPWAEAPEGVLPSRGKSLLEFFLIMEVGYIFE